MKFGIDMGHNAPPDTGAVGIRREDDLTKAVGTQVIAKLQNLGYSVVNCNPSWASSVLDSLRKRVQAANSNRVDIYVSIHFNAFNGRASGTEVFATSSAGRKIAAPVLNNVVALGYYNRGVKNGSHLYVLKNTAMPAILVECCFIDSRRDMDLYNTESMANAIVKGLTGVSPVQAPPSNQGNPSSPISANPEVLKLQKALNRLQIRDRNGKALVEDGITGPATQSATDRFHSIMDLQTLSAASAATWKAIEEIFERPILRPSHATGKAVRYLQFRISSAIDGIFGPNTAAAVKRYQQSNHLTVDGIVGPQTWNKLIG
ncbi:MULTISPECIES: N-acetylmuramoyl-L-alanine amidase [Spirulina sp. CCY15215]|uniref:N-acetylmuramoyl-L-alanine amidase n=1 Tax=Spirulina sp. CCY15215 TaxID=2767591 RepID=UPI00194EC000|nr:N-acetylmuramoyl-L-alanine amidase [Spirulina major]